MHQILDWALAIAAVLLLAGMAQQARGAGGGKRPPSPARKPGFRARRQEVRRIREKGTQDRLRDEARHRHRLAEGEQRLRAQAARAASGARESVRRTIRLHPEPASGDEAPAGPQGAGGAGHPSPPRQPPGPGGPAPAAPQPAPAPPPQSPPPPAPAPASEGTTTVTSPAIRTGIEDLVTAIDRIRARAVAGNAKAKLAALRACSAACLRFAQMAMTLAKQMREQGNYGPEITERASAAGIHLTAAASAFSDSANALATLLSMRLGDMPESGRQAPHHAELSETGAR